MSFFLNINYVSNVIYEDINDIDIFVSYSFDMWFFEFAQYALKMHVFVEVMVSIK